MTAEHCPMCAEWVFSKYHKCKPVWLVAIVEDEGQPRDDDYSEVRASDESEAAEKGAEEDDSNSVLRATATTWPGLRLPPTRSLSASRSRARQCRSTTRRRSRNE